MHPSTRGRIRKRRLRFGSRAASVFLLRVLSGPPEWRRERDFNGETRFIAGTAFGYQKSGRHPHRTGEGPPARPLQLIRRGHGKRKGQVVGGNPLRASEAGMAASSPARKRIQVGPFPNRRILLVSPVVRSQSRRGRISSIPANSTAEPGRLSRPFPPRSSCIVPHSACAAPERRPGIVSTDPDRECL